MNLLRFLWLLAIVAAFLVAGCDEDSTDLDVNTKTITTLGGTFAFQGDAFTLVVPAASVSNATNVTVLPAAAYPAESNLISSTAFTATNNPPATFSTTNRTKVRIAYPTLLGTTPADYRIYRVDGANWVILENQTVNEAETYVEADFLTPGTLGILTGPPAGPPTVFKTILSTNQEVGTVVAPDEGASGTATVTVPGSENQIEVQLVTSGLTGVMMAHIHRGKVGENGPIAATLYLDSMGAFPATYTKVVMAADLDTAIVPTMADLVDLIQANNAYINVHTMANPSGALRGQLGENVRLNATLGGDQEVPPTGAAGTGTGSVTFNRDMTEFSVVLDATGLTGDATMSHIHAGATGANGGVIFPLTGSVAGAFHHEATLTAADFTAQGGVDTYAKAVAAILSAETYFNIHTVAHPGGEIRGQILTPP